MNITLTPDPLPLSHPLYAYQGEGWVDDMLQLCQMPRITPTVPPVARPGSFWLSIATRRRASCLWATRTHVSLCFTDNATKVLTREQLLRLYTEAT